MDAAQTAGHMPVSMEHVHASALVVPAHKGLLGPQGIGAVLMSEAFAHQVNPLITGGTGMFPRDVTPDAVSVLFDRDIPGFGELFRAISYEEIGMSTIQSRAIAGISNRTLVFCLPGSTGACRTAWSKIIAPQLDPRINACGFTRVFNTWSAS